MLNVSSSSKDKDKDKPEPEDVECLSAKIIDHCKDHMTNLSSHSAALLTSSIFHKINVETNESKVLSSLQREAFTEQSLKGFIRKIWSLKNERNLPDDTAVSALSLLLPDVASRWWEDTRPFVNSWNLGVALMLKVLNSRRTLQEVWSEFETSNHQLDRQLGSFLREQRILLAEIRQYNIILPEQLEIDLIYFKLNSKIRKKIDRKQIASFDELAYAQRFLESNPSQSGSNEICSHCRQPGHNDTMCFGSRYEVECAEQKPRYQNSHIPYIAMKLNGIPDFVHLASDSDLNIITDSLYWKLVQRGCLFETSKQIVKSNLSKKQNVVQMTTAIVECNERLVVAPVVKLQNVRGYKNCFGIDFILACDLLSYLAKEPSE